MSIRDPVFASLARRGGNLRLIVPAVIASVVLLLGMAPQVTAVDADAAVPGQELRVATARAL